MATFKGEYVFNPIIDVSNSYSISMTFRADGNGYINMLVNSSSYPNTLSFITSANKRSGYDGATQKWKYFDSIGSHIADEEAQELRSIKVTLPVSISDNELQWLLDNGNWIDQPFTITYVNGTTDNPNPTEYTVRNQIIYLQPDVKFGYEFQGWYSDSSFTTQVTEILGTQRQNITLYAKWYEPPRTLKQAFTLYFNKVLNDYWKDLTADTLDKFSVQCDYEYDNGAFQLRQDTGQLVLNSNFDFEKYIPVAVGSFNGELAELPNEYIVDSVIPIQMLVPVEKIKDVIGVLELLQNNLNAQPITLRAKHLTNQNVDIVGVLNFNIPDDDEFQMIDGINAKIIAFQMVSTFTKGLFYGNSIKYELSFDNGTNWLEIKKITPSSGVENGTYSDQYIGDERVKSTPTIATWSQLFSVLINRTDNVLRYLLPLTDFTLDQLTLNNNAIANDHAIVGMLEQVKFRKTYTFSSNEVFVGTKDVVITNINYTDTYGEFITVSLTLADKMVID